jgi:hypothetical protein
LSEAVTPQSIADADRMQAASLRGRNADQILSNPVFDEAFAGMRQEIIDALTASALSDPSRLTLLTMQLQQLERLKVNFVSYMQAGKQADADLVAQRDRLAREQARLDDEERNLFGRGMRNAQRIASALRTPRQ